MFDWVIKIALKSALENPEIKERINGAMRGMKNQVRGKIIDLDKNSYKVLTK